MRAMASWHAMCCGAMKLKSMPRFFSACRQAFPSGNLNFMMLPKSERAHLAAALRGLAVFLLPDAPCCLVCAISPGVELPSLPCGILRAWLSSVS